MQLIEEMRRSREESSSPDVVAAKRSTVERLLSYACILIVTCIVIWRVRQCILQGKAEARVSEQ